MRTPEWVFTLLDEHDNPLRILTEADGGNLTLNGLSRLGGDATLSMRRCGDDIDFMKHRIKIEYHSVGMEPVNFGVWLLTSPKELYGAGGLGYTVDLLPKMQTIDEDSSRIPLAYAAGENIIDIVRSLIEGAGESRITATPSDAVLASPKYFDAGISTLDVVNELLSMAGYWSLFTDGNGRFRLDPYVLPANRHNTLDLRQDKTAIHDINWVYFRDKSKVPNVFIVTGNGDDENPPLVGVAEDTTGGEFSYHARGRWITQVEEGFDGADQTVFDARAVRRLTDAQSAVGKISVQHLVVSVWPNDVVRFRSHGRDFRASVHTMGVDFAPEAMVRAEWRQV